MPTIRSFNEKRHIFSIKTVDQLPLSSYSFYSKEQGRMYTRYDRKLQLNTFVSNIVVVLIVVVVVLLPGP